MIIISEKDPASLNIEEQLQLLHVPDIVKIKEESIYAEGLDKKNADLFIFASKHKSTANIPSLSVHFPGNWNTADLGGKEKTLSKAAPLYVKEAFLELHRRNPNLTTLEATHHGPYCNKPCFFIEIGSSLEQWKDKELGKIVAQTIKKVITTKLKKREVALGLGGPHYSNNFNKIELETDIALSHICPKHMLPFLNKDILQKAMQESEPEASFVILDWKGLGTEKDRIARLLNEMKIQCRKTKEF